MCVMYIEAHISITPDVSIATGWRHSSSSIPSAMNLWGGGWGDFMGFFNLLATVGMGTTVGQHNMWIKMG